MRCAASSASAATTPTISAKWAFSRSGSRRSLARRVYAPATGTTHAVAIALNPFTVYGWYYLDTFDEVAGGKDEDASTVNGVTYPRSVWADDWDYFEVNLGRACKTLTASMGLSDNASTSARETSTITGDSRQLFRKTGVKLGEMTPLSIDVTGILRLRIDDTHESGNDWQIVYGDARVLCAY